MEINWAYFERVSYLKINKMELLIFTDEVLIEMGFVQEHDGTCDPRSDVWVIENERFRLTIDCWLDTNLLRLDDDAEYADPIPLKVESIDDLKGAIDFIK